MNLRQKIAQLQICYSSIQHVAKQSTSFWRQSRQTICFTTRKNNRIGFRAVVLRLSTAHHSNAVEHSNQTMINGKHDIIRICERDRRNYSRWRSTGSFLVSSVCCAWRNGIECMLIVSSVRQCFCVTVGQFRVATSIASSGHLTGGSRVDPERNAPEIQMSFRCDYCILVWKLIKPAIQSNCTYLA